MGMNGEMSQSIDTTAANPTSSPGVNRSDDNATKVGLIIVDFRSWSESRGAIESALKSKRLFDFIVVVDNGGTVPERECRGLSERVTLIRAECNGGYAFGVNLGLRRLRADGATHALVLNPDARIREDTLEKLLKPLQDHANVAIVGPVIFSNEAETAIEFAGADALWHIGWIRQRSSLRSSDGSLSDEPVLLGCCWLMRMALLDEVGELPEGYFLYFEEFDYCQSVRRRGYRLCVVPDARCVHHGSWSVKKNSPLFRYQVARNRVWFMRRWARADQYASFLLFTALVKVPLACLLFGLRDRDLAGLSAFLRGFWHGVKLPVFVRRSTPRPQWGG